MNRCNINLGKDWILPARTRRWICRAMHIYLTLCGLLLTLAFYNAVLNVRRAADCRNAARMIRAQFNPVPAGRRSLLRYADRLRIRIEECTRQAQAVREALPAEAHTVLPLLNFLVGLSDGGTLNKLALIQENGKPPLLEFSLAVPAGGRKNPGSGILQNWQRNPELAKCFSSITPVTTHLGNQGDNEMFIVNYKAIFGE